MRQMHDHYGAKKKKKKKGLTKPWKPAKPVGSSHRQTVSLVTNTEIHNVKKRSLFTNSLTLHDKQHFFFQVPWGWMIIALPKKIQFFKTTTHLLYQCRQKLKLFYNFTVFTILPFKREFKQPKCGFNLHCGSYKISNRHFSKATPVYKLM